MSEEEISLIGKVCPYVVMHIIRDVGEMRSGETRKFVTDDPLAIKSIPEELEDDDDFVVLIDKHQRGWEITVRREER
jgi:TusA-related sulfurtransferase